MSRPLMFLSALAGTAMALPALAAGTGAPPWASGSSRRWRR